LTVKGQDFDRGAQVLINGVLVEQRAVKSIELDRNVCQIKFICPKQRVEGTKNKYEHFLFWKKNILIL